MKAKIFSFSVNLLLLPLSVVLFVSATSCQQKKFSSTSPAKPKPAAAAPDTPFAKDSVEETKVTAQATSSVAQVSSNVVGSNGVTFGSSISDGDKDAIKKCLNLWGNHPFKVVDAKAQPANFKKISSGVSIGGVFEKAVSDTTATSHDVLVLVDPSINILSNTEYKFMNPKGWYCMKFQLTTGSGEVKANTNVKLHCTAKIAKSNLVVGVSSTNDTAIVGINGSVGIGNASIPGTVAQAGVVIDGSVTLKRVNENFAEVCAP